MYTWKLNCEILSLGAQQNWLKSCFHLYVKAGEGLKKALFPRHKFTFHCQEIKRPGNRQILWISLGFSSGTGCRASRWERLSTLGTVVLCLFAAMKSLYLDRKGSLSVCAEHFSTSPCWLSPSSGFRLVRSCLLASQNELSGHFALTLCLSWFLWKASLSWMCWILLNSFSVLQDKGLCQERYKGSLWSAGSPFLLARASVMHIFPLLVACTSLLHCL